MKQKHAFVLALLLTILLAVNLFLIDSSPKERKQVLVTEIVDGDTISIDSKRARLLNINTPEKSERGYEEAKEYISKIENATIHVEELSTDLYGRILIRAYTPEYLNLEIVRKGLATKFLVEESETKLFAEAEKDAIINNRGIWQKSDSFNCFYIAVFPQEEVVKIKNTCEKKNIQNYLIKDESRKKYKFVNIEIGEVILHTSEGKDNETDIFWNSKANIWNNDRDTAYLFDSEGKIVAYHSYGY